jgi:hypothetical protein
VSFAASYAECKEFVLGATLDDALLCSEKED